MPYSESGYHARAEECVRLANTTDDEMLRAAILGLRQQYLHIAKRLKEIDTSKQNRLNTSLSSGARSGKA